MCIAHSLCCASHVLVSLSWTEGRQSGLTYHMGDYYQEYKFLWLGKRRQFYGLYFRGIWSYTRQMLTVLWGEPVAALCLWTVQHTVQCTVNKF